MKRSFEDEATGGSGQLENLKQMRLDKVPTSKERITDLVSSLGAGLMEPVAYDTAWIARVPDFEDPSKPAFPESLAWLREHQQPDGSWGSSLPINAHGNTLSTLAAILSLQQWNYCEEDFGRIQKGTSALWLLADKLPHEKYETIGFEILLPAMVREAVSHGWKLPFEAYQRYNAAEKEKFGSIQKFQKKYGPDKPTPWWFTLESLGTEIFKSGDPILPASAEVFLGGNPSVAGSPAATAYLLWAYRHQNKDLPAVYQYLKALTSKFGGGAPNVAPIDGFELSFGCLFLMEAGIRPTDPIMAPALQHLSRLCSNFALGYSNHSLVPDVDDTAQAANVLSRCGHSLDPLSLLRSYFNGAYLQTYPGERLSSVSANLNSLNFLRGFPGNLEVKDLINKLLVYFEGESHPEAAVFLEDKWHSSPLYPISRGVPAFYGLHPALFQGCLSWLLKNQHSDGGWGYHGESTIEETAHAALALSAIYRRGYYDIPPAILRQAQAFFSSNSAATSRAAKVPLWIGKSLYHPTLVVDTLVLAAEYSLKKALNLLDLKERTIKSGPKLVVRYRAGAVPLGPSRSLTFEADLISTVPKEINPAHKEIPGQTGAWALQHQICEPTSKLLKAAFEVATAYCFRLETPENLRLLADFSFAYMVLDDILDEEENLELERVQEALACFTAILQGRQLAVPPQPVQGFPKFTPLCKAFLSIRERIGHFHSALNWFNESIQEMFGGFLTEFKSHTTEFNRLDPKVYTEYRTKGGGAGPFFELGLVFRKIVLPESLHNHSTFAHLKRGAMKAMMLSNDLLSYAKDLKKGPEARNYALFKKASLRLSDQEAFRFAAGAHNRLLAKLIADHQQLATEFPGSEGALNLLDEMIQGHLDWTLESLRYKSGGQAEVTYLGQKDWSFQEISNLFATGIMESQL